MVKHVPDRTGRFHQRPFYTQQELDLEFDQIIIDFLRQKCGEIVFPIPTDVLTTLIERDTADLDLYADLSPEGAGVEGVTKFYIGQKPHVRIAQELSEDTRREHRLRTTLTHEYGHVKLHRYLWELESPADLFPQAGRTSSLSCHRDTLLDAPQMDWLEWQAGYACGALLMPISEIKMVVSSTLVELGLYGAATTSTHAADELTHRVAEHFDVSTDAARVRLIKLQHLTGDSQSPSLFS